MDQFHYRLVKPSDDHTAAVIEKSGITAEFTLAEVNAMQERNKKAEREVAGQLEIERAKIVNIEHFHPEVKDLSPELLVAAALYKESLTIIRDAEPKLEQIRAAIKENDDMVVHVIKELNLKPHGKKKGGKK